MSVVVIIGLIAALVVATRSRTITISSDYYDTWDVQESIAVDSKWIDKSKPPKLPISQTFQLVDSIASRINSQATEEQISNWHIIRLSLEELNMIGGNNWGYFVTLEGSKILGWDNSRGGMATVQHIFLLVLMDGSVHFDSANSTIEFGEIESQIGNTVVISRNVNEETKSETDTEGNQENPFVPSKK